MGTEDFPCPKCSQLNTIGQTTCKNCGADLKHVLDDSKHKEKATGASPTRILDIIVIIAFLGVIAFVMFPQYPHSKQYYRISAREVGGSIASSLSAAHSDYLINGNDYTLDDILSATAFDGGITYQPTDTDTPASGEIASNAAGTAIVLNYWKYIFKWDYTPRNGNNAAFLTEAGGNW